MYRSRTHAIQMSSAGRTKNLHPNCGLLYVRLYSLVYMGVKESRLGQERKSNSDHTLGFG